MGWTELELGRTQVPEPAASLLFPDRPGMQVPVTTTEVCLQLFSCWWPRRWVGGAILSPFEHTSFPWSTPWSGTRLLEVVAVSQHALKVISLLYCRSTQGSSWDLHYFLYKHIRCEHPVPKTFQRKRESQGENTGGETTQRWQKLPRVTDLVCRKASWRTQVSWFLCEWYLCWPRLSHWEWCKQ